MFFYILFCVILSKILSKNAVDVIIHIFQNIWRRNVLIALSNAKLFIDTKIRYELSV
jgi:hypothetical protein